MLIRLSVLPVMIRASTTPISDSGNDSITPIGAVNEPNCITRIRYISAIPENSAMTICLNSSCWSSPEPPSARP
jgi:hypothetical protein